MINSRESLITGITNYISVYNAENKFRNQFIELLDHPRCYYRDHLPGHITGSSWIIDQTHKYVLLTLHAKLNKWLQPGGHADGDEDILNVALREANEETGLNDFHLIKQNIFDVDIHTIPARRDFPEHLHYDIRFIFEASREIKLSITEESHDLQWVSLHDLENYTTNHSILRMREKTIKGL